MEKYLDLEGLKTFLEEFKNMMAGGGVPQDTKETTSITEENSN